MESHLSSACCEEGFIVRVIGRGTLRESPAFRAVVKRCLQHDGAEVTVDLSDCGYLDSTFMGGLVWLVKLAKNGSRLRFFVKDGERQQLFSYSTLDRLLHFVDSMPNAAGESVAVSTEVLKAEELGEHVMQCHRKLAELGGDLAHQFQDVADSLSRELDR